MFNELIYQLSIVGLCFIKMTYIFVSCFIPVGVLMWLMARITGDKAVNRKLYHRALKKLRIEL